MGLLDFFKDKGFKASGDRVQLGDGSQWEVDACGLHIQVKEFIDRRVEC